MCVFCVVNYFIPYEKLWAIAKTSNSYSTGHRIEDTSTTNAVISVFTDSRMESTICCFPMPNYFGYPTIRS